MATELELSSSTSSQPEENPPFREYPPEILGRIFLSTLQGPEDILTLPNVSTYTPWAIRQVCSLWRYVSLAQRRLWDRIIFKILGTDEDYQFYGNRLVQTSIREGFFQKMLDKAILIMPQAGPLHIGLECLWKEAKDQIVTMEHAIQFFIPRLAHRITSFSLDCYLDAIVPFFTLPRATFVNWVHLQLIVHEAHDNMEGDEFQPMYQNGMLLSAGSLRSLVLRGSDFLTILPSLQFQWAQLTNLEIVEGPDDGLSDFPFVGPLLRACVNLERCILEIPNCFDGLDPVESSDGCVPINLPKLRVFTLRLEHGVKHVLSRFELPALESLDICPAPCIFLAGWLQRLSPPLKIFKANSLEFKSLTSPPVKPAALEALSASMPFVEVLETDYLLGLPSLAAIASRRWFPQLQELSCHTNLDPLTFSDILSGRFNHSASSGLPRLRKVKCVSYQEGAFSEEDVKQECRRVLDDYGTALSMDTFIHF